MLNSKSTGPRLRAVAAPRLGSDRACTLELLDNSNWDRLHAVAAPRPGPDRARATPQACLNMYNHVAAREHPSLVINACTPGFSESRRHRRQRGRTRSAHQTPDARAPSRAPPHRTVETDLTRPLADSSRKSPAEMGMKPPEHGAHSAMALLFSSDVRTSGCYYGSDGVRSPLHKYRAPGDPPYTGAD